MITITKILLPLRHEELSYEGVWVRELAENSGEINNLPVFTREYKFGDVIKFNPITGKVMWVVEDGGYIPTEIVEHSGSFADAKAKWEAKGYVVEGIGRERLAVAKKYTEQDD